VSFLTGPAATGAAATKAAKDESGGEDARVAAIEGRRGGELGTEVDAEETTELEEEVGRRTSSPGLDVGAVDAVELFCVE
jgi:hypothetical protein